MNSDDKIMQNIKQDKENKFPTDSEWSTVNIAKRIIGYGFSFFILSIVLWMIYTESYQGIVYAIIAVIVCCIYLYCDIKIIRKEKHPKEN